MDRPVCTDVQTFDWTYMCGSAAAMKKRTAPRALASPKTDLPNAPPGARTLDTLIKSQVLYQLS